MVYRPHGKKESGTLVVPRDSKRFDQFVQARCHLSDDIPSAESNALVWRHGIQRHFTGGVDRESLAMSDVGCTLYVDLGGSISPYPAVHPDKVGPLEASVSVTATP